MNRERRSTASPSVGKAPSPAAPESSMTNNQAKDKGKADGELSKVTKQLEAKNVEVLSIT